MNNNCITGSMLRFCSSLLITYHSYSSKLPKLWRDLLYRCHHARRFCYVRVPRLIRHGHVWMNSQSCTIFENSGTAAATKRSIMRRAQIKGSSSINWWLGPGHPGGKKTQTNTAPRTTQGRAGCVSPRLLGVVLNEVLCLETNQLSRNTCYLKRVDDDDPPAG